MSVSYRNSWQTGLTNVELSPNIKELIKRMNAYKKYVIIDNPQQLV